MSQPFCKCGAAFGRSYRPGSKKSPFNEMESPSSFMVGIRQIATLVGQVRLPFCQKRFIKI